MASYDKGDRIRLGNHSALGVSAFKNSTGTDTDPTAVTLKVKDPEGTVVTYSWPTGSPALTRETTGRFYIDLDLPDNALVGTWYYRLAGTGTVMAAEEGSFVVNPSAVV